MDFVLKKIKRLNMELNICPLCGSPSIQKKKGVHQFSVRGELRSTPVVQYWECPSCKEVFLIATPIERLTRLCCRIG